MTLKKTDLAKNLASKIDGKMKGAPVPSRFGQAAAAAPDRREQRRLDAAAGLVAFACKLPAPLVARLQERAGTHAGGLNELIAEVLEQGLSSSRQGS